MKILRAIPVLLLLVAVPALADPVPEGGQAPVKVEHGFIEAAGAYGLQFGEQPFVPTGSGTTFKNPLTNGYAVDVTAGWEFLSGLALVGNWEYAASQSRDGQITNALDKVEGTIDYHTLALGLRWSRHLGPGRLFGELAAGVVLPFETKLAYNYNTAMSPISGAGTKIDEYNLGFGAYGQAGYQWDLPGGFYLGAALRVKSFQSDNDGKQTRLDNFVTSMSNPAPVTTTIKYDSNGPHSPTTYSVQDLRLGLALGFRL